MSLLIGLLVTVIVPLLFIIISVIIDQRTFIPACFMGIVMFLSAFMYFNSLGFMYEWIIFIYMILIGGAYAFIILGIINGG